MSSNGRLKALHFGAGNLGRGLVVPVLVDAAIEVAVADVDAGLVGALRTAGHYPLEIVSLRTEISTRDISIAQAFHVTRDREALEQWLWDATLITTSVQFENLSKLCPLLAAALDERLRAGDRFYVLACENLERSSTHLAWLMGLAEKHSPETLAGTFLDTVVDRNSQASWPKSLVTRTEEYWEWGAEVPPGVPFPVESIGAAPDIAPGFWRKRYLVNTAADALAFLGHIRGHLYLHQCFQDALLLDYLAPMFDELESALVHEYGFEREALDEYKVLGIRRLATPGVDRRIDTVARGAWRKLEPGERFVRPVSTLVEHGETPVGLARAVAAVIWVVRGLDAAAPLDRDVLGEVDTLWRDMTWRDAFEQLVFDQLGYLRSQMSRLKP